MPQINIVYHNEIAKRILNILNSLKLDDIIKDMKARHKNWPGQLKRTNPESTTKPGSTIPAQRKAGHTATWAKMERPRAPRDLKQLVLEPKP
jgi:hypothetical protein